MEVSFFSSCPLTEGLSVPLQTVRTSNSSLSSRAFVRVSFDFAHGPELVEGLVEWRWFEAVYRVVFFESMMKKKTPPCLFTS
jgi:hypothetical protein